MTESLFRWNAVCIDCAPGEFGDMVEFYAELLGLEVADRESRWAALRDPRGGMGINIQADDDYVRPVWPQQPDAPAMMMHFEVEVRDVDSAVAEAVALGATEAEWQPPDRDPLLLRVLLDPAGHPFCLWS
jgi:catechol 2,3-dioxygenase-like lactoylglutathione lyase family enzyme